MDLEVQDHDNSWSRQSIWGALAGRRVEAFAYLLGDMICEDDLSIDFGGNDGLCAEIFSHLTHSVMVDCDITKNRLEEAEKHNVKTLFADMASLPVPDNSFDWGFCSHTLEHLDDMDQVLREISRVIKRGVMFVIPLEKAKDAKKNPAHVRHNSDPEWWATQIESHGFEVTWTRDGLNRDDAIFLAFKPIEAEIWKCKKERESLEHSNV